MARGGQVVKEWRCTLNDSAPHAKPGFSQSARSGGLSRTANPASPSGGNASGKRIGPTSHGRTGRPGCGVNSGSPRLIMTQCWQVKVDDAPYAGQTAPTRTSRRRATFWSTIATGQARFAGYFAIPATAVLVY
jgi:hypothetical protein